MSGDVGLATTMYKALRFVEESAETLIDSESRCAKSANLVTADKLYAMDAAARYHHNDVAAFACGIQQDEDGCLVVKGKKLTRVEEDVLFGALVHRAVQRLACGGGVPFREEHFRAFREQE